jgi:hypothetical protein
MNRTLLGLIALVLLVVGGIAALRGPPDGSAAGLAGGCIRIGLVLGALWLALPQILAAMHNLPRWALSWLARRKGQPPRPPEGAPLSCPPEGASPPAPVKRPRRRSRM